MTKKLSDIDTLDAICRPVVAASGFDLILLEWVSDRGRRILRLYIDHEEAGVSVDDCARISRELGPVLDVEDAVPDAYALEVSTPGLDRPLARERDFQRFLGEVARVRLHEPLATGRKKLKGTLIGCEAGELSMEVDGEEISFPLQGVAKANLVYQGEL